LAVFVHLLIGALLVFGIRWHQTSKPPIPTAVKKNDTVKAVVVDDARVRAEMERIKREEQRKRNEELARQRQLDDAKRQAEAAEQKRKEEEAHLAEIKRKQEDEHKKLEIARKQAADEKKRQEDAARAAEQKRLVEVAERKRREEQQRKEDEAALREQLAAEEHEKATAQAGKEKKQREVAQAAKAASEIDRYRGLITKKVERSWVEPAASMRNLSCKVRVRLAPGGWVVDARASRSGNEVFDRSVENAVKKAEPLPVPKDPQVFEYMREIEFTFGPISRS